MKKLKNVWIYRWQQILVQNKNLIVGDLIRLFPENSILSKTVKQCQNIDNLIING